MRLEHYMKWFKLLIMLDSNKINPACRHPLVDRRYTHLAIGTNNGLSFCIIATTAACGELNISNWYKPGWHRPQQCI